MNGWGLCGGSGCLVFGKFCSLLGEVFGCFFCWFVLGFVGSVGVFCSEVVCLSWIGCLCDSFLFWVGR